MINNKHIIKINFKNAEYAADGSNHKGAYRITKQIYKEYKDYLKEYVKIYDTKDGLYSNEAKEKLYLNRIINDKEKKGNKVFLTITQKRFFNWFINESEKYEINNDRARANSNYYLHITDENNEE
jgi:hypothetical protein